MNKLILPIMLLALILCFGTAHANTTVPVPFAIDGPQVTNSFEATGCSSTCSVVLSTSYADDIIVVGISESSHPTSITMSDSASAINWIGSASTPIAEVPVKGTSSTLFLFEGIASPTLSSDLITETLSGSSGKTGMFVYAVSGANAITPIDSLATAQGNDTSSSITSQTSNSFSTSNANDMIMYFVGGATANPAISAPMPGSIGSLQSTLIGNIIQAPNLPWMLSEYANAMTLQASITASISWTNSASVVAWITQALEQAPPPPASLVYLQNRTLNPALVFPSNAICANTLVGICAGNDILSGSLVLNGDLYVNGNILLPSGSTLLTNGHTVVWTGTFTATGTINTGSANNNGISGTHPTNGISYPGSFGGSGSSGSSGDAPGAAGATPSAPVLTNANILSMYNNGMTNYLTGAPGGGGTCTGISGTGGNTISPGGAAISGGAGSGPDNPPSSGSFGGYFQGPTFNGMNGHINANSPIGYRAVGQCDDGGTGGGGALIIATQAGGYTAPTFNVVAADDSGLGYNTKGGNGQIKTYTYTTAPLTSVIFSQYYPIQLYTASASSFLNFSLYQTFNGVTSLLQANVTNIAYTPPSNQVPGIYVYNVLEFSSGIGLINYSVMNVSINMTDITNSISVNAPVIQYYPNLGKLTKGSFTALPISWKIWSYPNAQPAAFGVNTILGSVFGSASLVMPVNVQLTYAFTVFNISFVNNPAIQKTISQSKFVLIPSNTGSTAPNTRELVNISTYNQSAPAQKVMATSNFSSLFTINNYSFQAFNSFTANNFQIYIPASNAFTPAIKLNNPIIITNATGYTTAINNFLTQTITNVYKNYSIYLISNAASTSDYDLVVENISTSSYIASTIEVLLFSPSTNSSTVVAVLKTNTGSGVVTPLIIGGFYQFLAFSAGLNPTLIGQTGFIQATSCAPNTCLQVIPVGGSVIPFLPSTLAGIIQGCVQVPGASNTMTVSCTFTQTNLTSTQKYNARIQIFKNYLLNGGQPTCSNNVTAIGGTVLCTVNNINTTLYQYNFQIYIQGTWITINTGQFGTQQSLFGSDGGLMALIFAIVLGLVFIKINLNISIILVGLGLFISGLLGFIVLPSLAGGGILLFLGLVLYIINKDPSNNR